MYAFDEEAKQVKLTCDADDIIDEFNDIPDEL